MVVFPRVHHKMASQGMVQLAMITDIEKVLLIKSGPTLFLQRRNRRTSFFYIQRWDVHSSVQKVARGVISWQHGPTSPQQIPGARFQ